MTDIIAADYQSPFKTFVGYSKAIEDNWDMSYHGMKFDRIITDVTTANLSDISNWQRFRLPTTNNFIEFLSHADHISDIDKDALMTSSFMSKLDTKMSPADGAPILKPWVLAAGNLRFGDDWLGNNNPTNRTFRLNTELITRYLVSEPLSALSFMAQTGKVRNHNYDNIHNLVAPLAFLGARYKGLITSETTEYEVRNAMGYKVRQGLYLNDDWMAWATAHKSLAVELPWAAWVESFISKGLSFDDALPYLSLGINDANLIFELAISGIDGSLVSNLIS